MASTGRISGPLLKANLLREGVNLAFENDLLYLKVDDANPTNHKIGIKTNDPQYDLDVNGTTRVPNIEITNLAQIGDILISGNTIESTTSTLALGTLDNVVYQNRLTIDSLDIEGNRISSNVSNANIELAPNGTGKVEVHSNMNVQGNIYATGNITADGEIQIGDQDTDFIEFLSEVSSDIIPSEDNTYSLGSDPETGGKQWSDIYVQNFFAGTVDTSALEVDGIDLTLRQGNIYYVAENGDDALTGDHPQDPFATLSKALSEAVDGDTIHIYPGEYQEDFPLTVPAGVTVKGHSIRSVNISPTPATNDQDAFLLNGQTTIEDITVKDFFYNSVANTGHAFRYANNMEVTSRSPYIKNVSVITKGSVTSANDPRGFDESNAGRGAYLDGSVVTVNSKEAGCLFHSVTFITPGVDAVTFTNGVRVEWLNCFTYFANRGVYCIDGAAGIASNGKTALRVTDLTGSFSAGEDVEYYDSDGVTLLASGTIESVVDDKIFIDGKVTGFEIPTDRIGKTITINGNIGLDDGKKKFGTSSLALYGQSGEYANIAVQNDFGFGTGDFTVETWVYANTGGLAGTKGILDFRAGIGTDVGPFIFTSSGQPGVFINGSTVLQSGDALNAEQWYHIAVVRDSGTMTLYVDGVVKDSAAVGTNLGVTKPLTVGSRYDGTTSNWDGNIDDTRIVKGTPVYTGAFTPPITTLYNIPDTVLLLRYNGEDSSNIVVDETIAVQDIRFSGGASATEFTLVDYTDFGAEVRMIGSASVYGNYGIWGNGPGVIVYAIGQNLAYIGNGKESDNDATTVVQSNEVVELNSAKIRYNSVDHRGDLFTAANFNVSTDTGLTFTDGVNTTTILADKIDTGNLRISGNTIESLSGDINFSSASDEINLNNNVNVTGDLDVAGNVTLAGNITIGDELTDSIDFVAGIGSNIIPSETNTYSLGLVDKQWDNIWVESAYIDDVLITDNYITTTTSNANLELRANGTGYITIDNFNIDNFTITSTASDIVIQPGSEYVKINSTGALRVPVGDTVSRPSTEEGIVRYNTDLSRFEGYDGSDWIQLNGVQDLDGDTKITAELTQGANDNIIRFDVSGTTVGTLDSTRLDVNRVTVDDIEIDTNVIQTITTDTDLRFEAQGTGSVLLENFAFRENTITNTVADSVTTFVNTNNGYVKIDGSNGFVLPVGTSLNRPDPAFTEVGMLRFNSADGRVEAYDGAVWGSVAGQTGAITRIEADFLAVETVLYVG